MDKHWKTVPSDKVDEESGGPGALPPHRIESGEKLGARFLAMHLPIGKTLYRGAYFRFGGCFPD